jgi:hypothetical protein
MKGRLKRAGQAEFCGNRENYGVCAVRRGAQNRAARGPPRHAGCRAGSDIGGAESPGARRFTPLQDVHATLLHPSGLRTRCPPGAVIDAVVEVNRISALNAPAWRHIALHGVKYETSGRDAPVATPRRPHCICQFTGVCFRHTRRCRGRPGASGSPQSDPDVVCPRLSPRPG